MSIKSVMPSNHLTLCFPIFLLPLIFPRIGVFSNESALRIRWPKYWSFSFNISLSYEYSELISFRIDWFDLHVVQGTLKSLLQHYNLKASVLWCSAFFMVQLSHLCMSTGGKKKKTHNCFILEKFKNEMVFIFFLFIVVPGWAKNLIKFSQAGLEKVGKNLNLWIVIKYHEQFTEINFLVSGAKSPERKRHSANQSLPLTSIPLIKFLKCFMR